MGLGDMISRVVISVKAETQDAKKSLHELNGALDAMGKFSAMAREAISDYGEHTRLSANTAGINIEKLSKSFQGLISEHDLLSFASKTSRGAFKLTQNEMDKVAQASIALRNQGHNLTEVVQKLTSSMVKGKAEGLDDFGLSIGNADTKAGRLKNIMGELDRVIKESGQSTGEYADDVARLAIEWDNTVAAAKRYTVELMKGISVNDMSTKMHKQLLLESDGALGGFFRQLDTIDSQYSRMKFMQNLEKGKAQGTKNILDRNKLDPDKQEAADKKAAEAAKKHAEEMAKLAIALLGVETASIKAVRVGEELRAQQEAQSALISQLESDYSMGGQGRYNAEMEQLNQLLKEGKISWDAYGLARQKAWEAGGRSGVASSNPNAPGVDYNAARSNVQEAGRIVAQMQQDLLAKRAEMAKSRTDSRQDALFGTHVIFGKQEEWDVWIGVLGQTGAAFSAFGAAVGAGYEAIVTGAGGVGAAIKKTMADGLMAIGKSSVVEALRETALGFASLALGPLGGASAAMHFKAAALHGAVAVAAGAAAHGLGTSAQVAASDSAAAAKAKEEEKAQKELEKKKGSGASGSGADGLRPIQVFVGDYFNGDERRRRQQSEEAIDRALRERDA
jgi:hypothetical protein